MAPLFRADQVGSLLRPKALLELRTKAGVTSSYDSISSHADVTQATHAAVAEAARKQLDLAIRPVTTGELERTIFYGGFFETLEGLAAEPALPIPGAFRTNFCTTGALRRAGITARPGVVATGRIRWAAPAYGASWELLKGSVPRDRWGDCKVTMPSPTYQHMQLRKGTAYSSSSGYGSDAEYFADLAAAFRAELRFLYDAGLRNVQIDDPNMTFFVMDEFREGCRIDGIDPDELMEEYIKVHNECIAGRPKDMHVGIHLCRGNLWNELVSPRGLGSGSYERMAERMFNGLDYDTFFLEYDDERSGDFEPLRFLPKGKVVVLGIVSTKRFEMESMDDLVRRVNEAAVIIAKGQGRSVDEVMEDSLAVSPQCGFSSQSQGGGKGMTEERQWEKLVLVRDLARRLWKDAV